MEGLSLSKSVFAGGVRAASLSIPPTKVLFAKTLVREAFQADSHKCSWDVVSNKVLRFAVDENFNNDIVWGLLRRNPTLDIVRIQDVGLSGADDPQILSWSADNNRILLTHDVKTVTLYAYERITKGLSMPGVVEVSRFVPVSLAIDDLLLLAEASLQNEWANLIVYLPFR